MRNAVIYARYSSSNQREESIEDQVRVCKATAFKDGYKIINIYADSAKSGMSVHGRFEFMRMIEDSAKGDFERVYVYKHDRFARDRQDARNYKAELMRNGVEVVSSAESIPQGALGVLMESMIEGYAEFYSVNLSENVRRGLHGNALKGKHNGVPCYGYERGADGYYHIAPAEAQDVQFMFEQYAKGVGMKSIAEALNKDSASTKRWHTSRISRMLKNPKYIGLYKFNGVELEGAIDPIVDLETWNEVQDRMESRKAVPTANRQDYPLSGRLFDSEGNTFTGTSGTSRNGTRYYYYKNAKTGALIRRDALNETIAEAISNALKSDEGLCKAIVEGIVEEQEEMFKESDRIRLDALKRKKEIEKEISNTIDFIAKFGGDGQCAEKLANLNQEKDALELVISEQTHPRISRDFIEYVIEELKTMTAPELVVDGIIDKVVFLDDEHLAVSFTFDEKRTTSSCPEVVLLCSEWQAESSLLEPKVQIFNMSWILYLKCAFTSCFTDRPSERLSKAF